MSYFDEPEANDGLNGGFDTAQVCLGGHTITDVYHRCPQSNQEFCEKCGQRTIISCPECNAEIRGLPANTSYMGEGHGTPTPPAYCHKCGEAYPWTVGQPTPVPLLSLDSNGSKGGDVANSVQNGEKVVDLLQSLLEEARSLPLRDDARLDALKQRADMVLTNLFGRRSEHLEALRDIRFAHINYTAGEADYRRWWKDGHTKLVNHFANILEEVKTFGYQTPDRSNDRVEPVQSRRIFVVHGRDGEAKESVARLLEKLKLDPIILHEQANQGRTLIEKFEGHAADVEFAVVLLTPDDEGNPKSKMDEKKDRARQNVILELGFFLGTLGRKGVCALYKEGVELPSDIDGLAYVLMDRHGKWKMDLAKELKAAGIDVDLNNVV